MTTFKTYYFLTKPGIIYGNALTAIGGFFLAAKGHIDIGLFFAMLFGLSFVIGSACAFNNYIDRGIDAKMKRTQRRALVTKKVPASYALAFASTLGLVGFALLLLFTNLLTTFIAFIGYFFYIVMYGIWKRRSIYGTVVGSISGAVPPVVGYCAVTNQFDLAAVMLFLILVFWQMPHFYAIAIFRYNDYAAASIPVLPVKKGMVRTKIEMLLYGIAFLAAIFFLTVFHYTGYTYLVILGSLGLFWLGMTIQGFRTTDLNKWARQVFVMSLVIILFFSLLLSFNAILP